jgi:hypothetical protein
MRKYVDDRLLLWRDGSYIIVLINGMNKQMKWKYSSRSNMIQFDSWMSYVTTKFDYSLCK